MKNIKGTQTEKNLYKTFAGECRARSKYNMFSEKAREEGYESIADVFDETAGNEFAHAREVFNRFLRNIGCTEENLLTAAMGETDEYKNIYKEFEECARKEGFDEIADFYKELREVEEAHKERYMKLYDKMKSGTVFTSKEPIEWICLNCGYIYEGKEAPDKCPLCKYPKGFFEPKNQC